MVSGRVPFACRITLAIGIFLTAVTGRGQGLDPSFGQSGFWEVDHSYCGDSPRFLQFTPNGRTLVGGREDYIFSDGLDRWFFAQFLWNGAADTDFGDEGYRVINPCVSNDEPRDMLQAADGSIYMGGYEDWNAFENDDQATVGRISAAGTPDLTYGDDGFDYFRTSDDDTYAIGIATAPGGGLNVLCYDNASPTQLYLKRRLPSSGADSTFATYGTRILSFAPDPTAVLHIENTIRSAEGGFFLLGNVTDGTGVHFAVAKVDVDGLYDPSFGGDGWTVDAFSWVYSTAIAAIVDQEGRLLVSARIPEPTLMRYLPNGERDMTFGVNGMVVMPGNLLNGSLAVDQAGRIIVFQDDALHMFSSSGQPVLDFGINGHYALPDVGHDRSGGIIGIPPVGGILVVSKSTGPATPPVTFAPTTWLQLIHVVYDVAMTISDPADRPALMAYPDPAHDRTTLTFPTALPRTLTVFDAQGRAVQQRMIGTSNVELDISGLRQGVYSVLCSDAQGVRTTRFMKE